MTNTTNTRSKDFLVSTADVAFDGRRELPAILVLVEGLVALAADDFLVLHGDGDGCVKGRGASKEFAERIDADDAGTR